MPRRQMTPAASARYKAGLARALDAGYAVLAKHGTAMDAVCAAVVELEDSPLFNAGRGACFNTDEKHELDASVMDGATLRAGAVAAVSRIRNPVLAARAVMDQSHHVLLVGRGAERFARRAASGIPRSSAPAITPTMRRVRSPAPDSAKRSSAACWRTTSRRA